MIVKSYNQNNTMNLQSIKYLAALSTHQHFGKAAAACCVSQPTLSMQIKKLEEELNVQLLERTNKSVTVTEIGKIMAEHANTILHEIRTMQETAKTLSDPESGSIRLGIIPTLAPYLLPHIMPVLTRTFPRLTYYLFEEKTVHLLEKIKKTELDCLILALPVLEKNLIASPLFKEEFLLAIPSNHRLSKNKKINSTALRDENILLLEEGHCLRDQALDVCAHKHATEDKNFRATSLETLRQIVQNGMGITLMPKLACEKNKKISYMKFSANPPFRQLGLVWRNKTPRDNLFNQMSKVICGVMRPITSFKNSS
jgi:LysR family hydrogen peroxide-inducible transcriptional activator